MSRGSCPACRNRARSFPDRSSSPCPPSGRSTGAYGTGRLAFRGSEGPGRLAFGSGPVASTRSGGWASRADGCGSPRTPRLINAEARAWLETARAASPLEDDFPIHNVGRSRISPMRSPGRDGRSARPPCIAPCRAEAIVTGGPFVPFGYTPAVTIVVGVIPCCPGSFVSLSAVSASEAAQYV
jgi:hypothetical protein